jgi:hypothetical protein
VAGVTAPEPIVCKKLLKRAFFSVGTLFILGHELRSVAGAFVVASGCS